MGLDMTFYSCSFRAILSLFPAVILISCSQTSFESPRTKATKSLGELNRNLAKKTSSKNKDSSSSRNDKDKGDGNAPGADDKGSKGGGDSKGNTSKETMVDVKLNATNGDNPYLCEANAKPSATRAKRLSRYEYISVITSLFSPYLEEKDLKLLKSELQADTSVGLYKELDSSISFQHVESFFALSRQISTKLASIDAFTKKHFPCTKIDKACVDTFGKEIGERIIRRPWTNDDTKTYLAVTKKTEESFSADVESIISACLQAPGFIYKIYLGDKEVSPGVFELNSSELAHRLSFAITGTIPDSDLMKDVKSKKILEEKVYNSHVERLFSSKDAQNRLNRFYAAWLSLDKLGEAGYEDYFTDGLKVEGLADAARKEMIELMNQVILKDDGNYGDLLSTRIKVSKDPLLEQIYKLAPDGSDLAEETMLPESRKGIMTRIGFLMSGDNQTHLVHRGLKVRVNMLCDQIKSPEITEANMALFTPIEPDPGASAREQIEARTAPASCMKCHTSINPPGFVMEAFDGTGRERLIEKVFKDGKVIKEHKISINTPPNIESPDEPDVSSLAELSLRIAKSSKGPACVVTSWLKFSRQHAPHESDSCELKALYDQLTDQSAKPLGGEASGTIKNFLKASVLTDQFKLVAK